MDTSRLPEPLCEDIYRKYGVFSESTGWMWDDYRCATRMFWIPDEIHLQEDRRQWETLSEDDKHLIKRILAFFAQADDIVSENIEKNFLAKIQHPGAIRFYRFQAAIEDIHADTYDRLLELYVPDKEEREYLKNSITTIPSIKMKADWALKWSHSDVNFEELLIAYAIVEGLFFSSSFCAIFWFKSRGKLPGLCQSNELISRDENLHFNFASKLYRLEIQNKLSTERIYEIFKEAVMIEEEFVKDILPNKCPGMNVTLMTQYVRYVADDCLIKLGVDPLFNESNPFTFMVQMSVENKTNFFERRVTEYQRGSDDTKLNFNGIENEDF